MEGITIKLNAVNNGVMDELSPPLPKDVYGNVKLMIDLAMEDRIVKFLETKGVDHVETSPQKATRRKRIISSCDTETSFSMCLRKSASDIMSDSENLPNSGPSSYKAPPSLFKRRMGGGLQIITTKMESNNE
eukprot:TRINITY_DN4766_c0_g4_i1.p1 TRINITY_DN4766_c0_g4~~TRINITY_DN4766_c0_g4_i1.p1  ORF type:complete len:132 (+),score=15.56 TRINITY_DN4766_c0_g4_i1:41-436(+)